MNEISLSKVNLNTDKLLSDTFSQISDSTGYPSVHHIYSYLAECGEKDFAYYHIFECLAGKSVINYEEFEYRQLDRFIDLSQFWQIFAKDSNGLRVVNKLYREI